MLVRPIPAPFRIIPFVMRRPEDHVAEPAGTITASPGLADKMAA
jgi:hypothetical protein